MLLRYRVELSVAGLILRPLTRITTFEFAVAPKPRMSMFALPPSPMLSATWIPGTTQQFFEIARTAVCDLAAPDQGRCSRHVQAVFGAARAADEYGRQRGEIAAMPFDKKAQADGHDRMRILSPRQCPPHCTCRSQQEETAFAQYLWGKRHVSRSPPRRG